MRLAESFDGVVPRDKPRLRFFSGVAPPKSNVGQPRVVLLLPLVRLLLLQLCAREAFFTSDPRLRPAPHAPRSSCSPASI